MHHDTSLLKCSTFKNQLFYAKGTSVHVHEMILLKVVKYHKLYNIFKTPARRIFNNLQVHLEAIKKAVLAVHTFAIFSFTSKLIYVYMLKASTSRLCTFMYACTCTEVRIS